MAKNGSFEERKVVGQWWAWLIIICFSLSFVAWGMFLHSLIPEEQERYWDFGALADVPGQSEFSTNPVPPRSLDIPVPQQIESLPEAESLSGGQVP